MDAIYEIRHGDGSQRSHWRGIKLKLGESCFIDDLTVAAEASRWGWTAKKLDKLPKGEKLINCANHPLLRQVMSPDSPRLTKVEHAKFKLTAPVGWSSPFCYGFDMRRPFEVGDSEMVKRLQIRAKDLKLQPFKVERVSQAPAAPAAPKAEKPKRGRKKKRAPAVEGADLPRLKGGPLTTQSAPREG